MPWYLGNSHGSNISLNSLEPRGSRQVHVLARKGHYLKLDGSLRYGKAFREDLRKASVSGIQDFVRKRKTPAHFLPSPAGPLLSDPVRGVIDRLEPGIHQPSQVRVFNPGEEPYFWNFWLYSFNNIPSFDAIDLEASCHKTYDKINSSGNLFVTPIIFSRLGSRAIGTFLDARAIEGRHFFREGRGTYKWNFFSDELYAALKREDLLKGSNLQEVGLTHT